MSRIEGFWASDGRSRRAATGADAEPLGVGKMRNALGNAGSLLPVPITERQTFSRQSASSRSPTAGTPRPGVPRSVPPPLPSGWRPSDCPAGPQSAARASSASRRRLPRARPSSPAVAPYSGSIAGGRSEPPRRSPWPQPSPARTPHRWRGGPWPRQVLSRLRRQALTRSLRPKGQAPFHSRSRPLQLPGLEQRSVRLDSRSRLRSRRCICVCFVVCGHLAVRHAHLHHGPTPLTRPCHGPTARTCNTAPPPAQRQCIAGRSRPTRRRELRCLRDRDFVLPASAPRLLRANQGAQKNPRKCYCQQILGQDIKGLVISSYLPTSPCNPTHRMTSRN